jgi:pyruvate/2-oxoglutarate dehydrogenase complex dihydrolipoamide acyltransferase (E2) component
VRRLVRQFELDITGIHGSGPEGRIRVGDVMGLLGGRRDSGVRDAPRSVPSIDDTVIDPIGEDIDSFEAAADGPVDAPSGPAAAPTTTVFDCDLTRVLAHRKKLRQGGVDTVLTSYFLVALADALAQAPEVTGSAAVRFGAWLTTPGGEQRSALVDTATIEASSFDERLRAFDAALLASLDTDTADANLLIHHYGESGSLLTTPTPLGAGHAASVGIGRVRREIVLRSVAGAEQPRVATCCYLSLSFHADRLAFHRASRFMAHATRVLEQWPE